VGSGWDGNEHTLVVSEQSDRPIETGNQPSQRVADAAAARNPMDMVAVFSETESYTLPPRSVSVVVAQNFSPKKIWLSLRFRLARSQAKWSEQSVELNSGERKKVFQGQTTYPEIECSAVEARFLQ